MKIHFPALFQRSIFMLVALLSSLIGSALCVTPVQAAGIVVNTEIDEAVTNDLCSLREAITNANDDAATHPDCAAGSGVDIITFASNYTITLQSSQLPVIMTDITINGNGPEDTIIQASACNPVTLPAGCTPATYRVFELSSPGNLTLDQLSVRNGQCFFDCYLGGGIFLGARVMLTVTNSTFSGNLAGGYGGAIYVSERSTLVVTNSIFSGNSAVNLFGGCTYVSRQSTLTVTDSSFSGNSTSNPTGCIDAAEDSTLVVTDSSFSGNSSAGITARTVTMTVTDSIFSDNSYDGISVSQASDLTVIDSTFSGNSGRGINADITRYGTLAVTNSTFSGNSDGGIRVIRGTARVINSTFSGNSAEGGGGIFALDHATLHVEGSTFSSNSATTTGGGISTEVGGTLTVRSSTFSANTAADGGGIYFRRSEGGSVLSSTFVGNQATAAGGGMRGVESSGVIITNSTFSANTADTGGGLGLIQSGVMVRNSTFSGNSAATGGGIHGERSSLSLANTIVANSPSGGNCAGGIINDGNNLDSAATCRWGSQKASMSNTDPKLGPLASNGGPTQTHALLLGSPAINAGDPNMCNGPDVNGVDQRGVTRPQGAGCDIGAYEYQPLVLPETPTFGDVAKTYWAWEFIERLYNAGITGGCSTNPLQYCPEGSVTRAQMAVFLLRGIHTSAYTPPAVGASTGFGDVPTTYWAAAWIKQMAAEGITTGCGNGNYCPEDGVTRAQMAVFLLRSKHGAAYVPPAVGASTGFGDVPTTYWAAAWIKQLVAEGITSGCGASTYCPESPVTRAQMAVFLVRTFNLP